MSEEKGYDINKEFERCGIYRPLRIEQKNKELEYDFDREKYCEILKEFAETGENIYTRGDFLSDLGQSVFDEDDTLEKDVDKVREKNIKRIRRLHNRLLEGQEYVKGSQTVASDKSCYYFLRKVEAYAKKTLLREISDEMQLYNENKYIYSLVLHLIMLIRDSDLFNYIQYSTTPQSKCYQNYLKMVEKNVEEIFGGNPIEYKKWIEIIEPLQRIINEGSYPGLRPGIWIDKCEELKYFDASYEIASDYILYEKVKDKLIFDLGNNRWEVLAELDKKNKFFEENNITPNDLESEKVVFSNIVLKTYRAIVNEYFGLEV